MGKKVQIKLHGDLGKTVGQYWNLSVSSVSEAIHAINILSNKKLYPYLLESDKKNIKYKVIVNKKQFIPTEEFQKGEIEAIKISELCIKQTLETIDIVPVIEGGDKGIIAVVLGSLLIIAGIVLIPFSGGLAAGLIVAGIGILAAGVMVLLSKPPDLGDISAPGTTRASYLFSGPVNSIAEGGPIPLAYGRVIVGSQVIESTYDVERRPGGNDDSGDFQDARKDDDANGVVQSTEGVIDNYRIVNGRYEGKVFISIANVKLLDLISEGPIGGLVNAHIDFTGKGTRGNIGYDSEPLISEFRSQVGANTNWLRAVYWNQVPVLNNLGQLNFQYASASFSHGYSSALELVADTEELQLIRQIGERFTHDLGAKTFRIYNPQCNGVIINIKISNLYTTEHGKQATWLYPTPLDFTARFRPILKDKIPAWTTRTTRVVGFITQGYLHQYRFRFVYSPGATEERIDYDFTNDPNFIAWEVEIKRDTEDSRDPETKSITYIDSIAELYTTTFTYPDCAIVKSKFDAEFFAQIPDRAFEIWGKKIKVPSNYVDDSDPDNPHTHQRHYEPESESQEWDGEFYPYLVYSNNPAWIFYDILTNQRYGLGKYIPENIIDKWTLYDIAKYCDELVDDGYGGLEPRFTCNVYFQTRAEAYKVLNDLASIFNSIVYYGAGMIYAVQDCPKDPIVAFTNANVVDGDFTYSNSSKKFRHTVAKVRWNDPQNFYKPTIEYVEDLDNIRKFGIKEIEMTAFACTSRGQALRLGRYVLLSENLETDTINFTTGLEAAYLKPGDIIKVFDKNRKVFRFAGRLSQFTNSGSQVFLLDNNITSRLETGVTYKFSVLTPGWHLDPSQHSEVITESDIPNIRKSFLQSSTFTTTSVTTVSSLTQITFTAGTFNTTDYTIEAPCVWVIEKNVNPTTYEDTHKFIDEDYDLFRVIKIEEKEGNKYEVFGLQYVESKFDEVENGLRFDRAETVYQATPDSPTSLETTPVEVTPNTQDLEHNIIVPTNSGVTDYYIFESKDGDFPSEDVPTGEAVVVPVGAEIGTAKTTVAETGVYRYRVYSFNREANKFSTTFASSQVTITNINSVRDLTINRLTLQSTTGSNNSSQNITFSTFELNPIFNWDIGSQSNAILPDKYNTRFTIRQPSSTLIPGLPILYETIIPTSGNVSGLQFGFDFNLNKTLSNGPFRNYDVVVEAFDGRGNTSAGNTTAPLSVVENGWAANPGGYEILQVKNPPISGVDLTSGSNLISFNGSNYQTEQYFDIHGNVLIKFSGITLPSDIIGGRVFASRSLFTRSDAITGNPIVKYSDFQIDSQDSTVFAHTRLNTLNLKSGYVGLMLFDSFDAEYKRSNPNTFWTGLYLSNIVGAHISGNISNLEVANYIEFWNNSGNNNSNTKINVVSTGGNAFAVIAKDSQGNDVIISTYKP